MSFLSLIALGALLSGVLGCDPGPSPGLRDGGDGEGGVPPTSCTPGTARTICRGNEAVMCNADGTEGASENCLTTGRVCTDGVGCTMCRPNSFQCNGDTVERCDPTGSTWTTIATCDASAGQTCNSTIGACSSPCQDAVTSNSYIGCEYWPVTTMNSQVSGVEFTPAVVVANPQTAPANVTVTGPAGYSVTRTVNAGAIETIELPWVDALKNQFRSEASVLAPNAAYRLVSTLPVTVYQFNPLEYQVDAPGGFLGDGCAGADLDPFDGLCHSFSNDASLLLPTHVLTGNYIVMSWPTMQLDQGPRGGGVSSSPGFFAVVGASATPVTVNIQFRGHVRASADGVVRAYRAGESGSFTLNQGDVLQIAADAPPSCTPGTSGRVTHCIVGADYDLTGTEIRATAPVQVIAGHNCTFIPYDRFACDHLEQAIFPLEAWGRESIMSKTQPPMGRVEPNVVRIVSGADNNMLTFEPSSVHAATTVNRGDVVEFEASESFRVAGTEAFLLGQFIVGQNYHDSTAVDAEGDPAMSLGIPSEQFRTSYTFLAPTTYPTNFVNVTAPTGATVTLDGSPVSGASPVGGTGFSVAQVAISGGQHSITGDQGFGIVVYGYGRFTSYMYPGGLNFEEINIPF